MENTFKISISADNILQEIIIAQTMDVVSAFEQTDSEVHLFVDTLSDKKTALQVLEQHFDSKEIRIEELEPQNWNETWESNFAPIEVTGFCQIRASFHPVNEKVKHHFLLSPKMAFGTGHHETTYMMLESMKDVDFSGKKVLDIGCGTGILALMAKKIGASYISMMDIEVPAIENSKEHATLNAVEIDDIQVGDLEVIAQEPFDIVYANINRGVILQLFPYLEATKSNKTQLFLSGILKQDEHLVLAKAAEFNWKHIKTQSRGNWLRIDLVNAN